jgi:uncharacterized membrane protein YhaH (DUF805 family)
LPLAFWHGIQMFITMETNNPYQTPANASGAPAKKLSAMQILFSFTGRIPRSTFWLYSIISSLVVGLLAGCVFAALIAPSLKDQVAQATQAAQVETPAAGAEIELPAGEMASEEGVAPGDVSVAMPSINPVAILVLVAVYIPLIWISLALQVKRWHDRDKSGAWVFIGFIPLIGPIWALVECGFLRGTVGPNRYGNDPI